MAYASAPLAKFVIHRGTLSHELRKQRGAKAHPDQIESVPEEAEPGCALDSRRLSHFLRRTSVHFGGKCFSKHMILVPLCDLKFLTELAADGVGTSNRRHERRNPTPPAARVPTCTPLRRNPRPDSPCAAFMRSASRSR